MTSDKRHIQFRGESQDKPTSDESKKTYRVRVQCSNCEQINDADIHCGVRIDHAECPYCGCPTVELTLAETDFNTMTARRIFACIGVPQSDINSLIDMILSGTVEITQDGISLAISELEGTTGTRPEPGNREVRDPRTHSGMLTALAEHLDQSISTRLAEMGDGHSHTSMASMLNELTNVITSDGQVHPGYPEAPVPAPQGRLVPGPAGDASARRAPRSSETSEPAEIASETPPATDPRDWYR